MNRPFPVNAVIIVILPENAGAIDYYHAGFGTIINRKFAANIPYGIIPARLRQIHQERDDILLKAIMQYYRRNNEPWIDHGIAQTAVTYNKTGTARFNYPCPCAATMNQLEARPHSAASQVNVNCAEASGSRFFLKFQTIIGANALWNTITEL